MISYRHFNVDTIQDQLQHKFNQLLRKPAGMLLPLIRYHMSESDMSELNALLGSKLPTTNVVRLNPKNFFIKTASPEVAAYWQPKIGYAFVLACLDLRDLVFIYMQRPVDFGTYYGYPECCISYLKEVISTLIPAGIHYSYLRTESGEHLLAGTGFRPCPVCAKKNVDDLCAEINSKRISTINFPAVHTSFHSLETREMLNLLAYAKD